MKEEHLAMLNLHQPRVNNSQYIFNCEELQQIKSYREKELRAGFYCLPVNTLREVVFTTFQDSFVVLHAMFLLNSLLNTVTPLKVWYRRQKFEMEKIGAWNQPVLPKSYMYSRKLQFPEISGNFFQK